MAVPKYSEGQRVLVNLDLSCPSTRELLGERVSQGNPFSGTISLSQEDPAEGTHYRVQLDEGYSTLTKEEAIRLR
jgi:hypothetical protein